MKKVLLFCGGLLVAATLLFMSCGKDKEVTPTINKFFSVENASLINKNMPEPTLDEQIAVVMNENVITGGSSIVRISSERVAKKILVGMKDQDGYYEVAPTTRGDCSFVMMVEPDINLGEGVESFTVLVAIEDENGDITQIWESSVTLLVVGTGALQVSLSFDNAKDVDLHLIEPDYMYEDGTPVGFSERHIYYVNHWSAANGHLDLDSNPGCSIDSINNENITYNDSTAYVAPGTYKVYVDLYENCDPTIATNYVVLVTYDGNVIASKSGIFEVGAESTYNPINELYVYGDEEQGIDPHEPFLTFTIGGNVQKTVKPFEPAPMTASAIEKEANSVH